MVLSGPSLAFMTIESFNKNQWEDLIQVILWICCFEILANNGETRTAWICASPALLASTVMLFYKGLNSVI